jgi:hypothetical protein
LGKSGIIRVFAIPYGNQSVDGANGPGVGRHGVKKRDDFGLVGKTDTGPAEELVLDKLV